MKRSSAIALTAMGAGTLAMVAAGNEVTRTSRYTYQTVAACAASGLFTESQCQEAETNAQGLVEKRARFYASAAACEAACGPATCTAVAPQIRNLIASSAVEIPPIPQIGIRTTCDACHTMRSALSKCRAKVFASHNGEFCILVRNPALISAN